jgi:hypothetical protein
MRGLGFAYSLYRVRCSTPTFRHSPGFDTNPVSREAVVSLAVRERQLFGESVADPEADKSEREGGGGGDRPG